MAADTGFQQLCPHCEAKVPIKDESLIGEEVTCPKCKNAFVVEDPSDEASAAPAPVKKKRRFVKDADEGQAGGAVATEEAPAEPKKKGLAALTSNKMALGLGAGGIGIILLGVAGYFIFFGGKSENKGATGGGAVAGRGPSTPGGPTPAPSSASLPNASTASAASKPEFIPIRTADPTNLLPTDTEIVIHVRVLETLKNELGRLLLENPSTSSQQTFKGRFGIPIEDIDRLILSGKFSQDSVFQVIRTTKPINKAAMQHALHLKTPEPAIQGMEYFLTPESWLEGGNPFQLEDDDSSAANPSSPRSHALAVCMVDSQTLVLADVAPMKQFLEVKGQPKFQAPAASSPAPGESPAPGLPGRRPGPRPGATAEPSSSSGKDQGAHEALRADDSRERAEPFQAGPPGSPAQTQAQPKPPAGTQTTAPAGPSNSYLTINSSVKQMLDRAEAKPPILISVGINTESRQVVFGPLVRSDAVYALAMSFQMKESMVFMAAFDCQNKEAADKLRQNLANGAKLVAFAMGLKYQAGAPRPKTSGRRTGLTVQTGPGGGRPGAAFPTGPGGSNEPEPGSTAYVDAVAKEKVVTLTADLNLDKREYNRILGVVEPYVIRTQGQYEMATSHPNPYQLSLAARQYVDEKQQFPRGTVDRQTAAARANLPWPPNQRVSWMMDLLPYLGYQGVYNRIHTQKSWQDPDNLVPASTLIVPFLDARSPRGTWYVSYPGMQYEVAATHFVGMAGVGLDAAEYSADDPALQKKVGIFGYDRVTRLSDVQNGDGLSNTIMVIQVPPAYKAPWIAGGGSTIRGVPEKDSIQPFVSTQYEGKAGTFAVMADGSVRFLNANMSDSVFKSLCTIRGGEPVPNINGTAPLLPRPKDEFGEDQAEIRTSPAPTPPANKAESKKSGS